MQNVKCSELRQSNNMICEYSSLVFFKDVDMGKSEIVLGETLGADRQTFDPRFVDNFQTFLTY